MIPELTGRARRRDATPQPRNDAGEADDKGTTVELRADGEPVTEVAGTEAGWAPGEQPIRLPADESLSVHPLTADEPDAELIDIGEDALELPAPDDDEPLEAEAAEIAEGDIRRNVLRGHDLEVRYEGLDPGAD
jgi:hypothetical protein